MIDDILAEAGKEMDKTIDAYRRDLSGIRTGRATLSLLDGIYVDYFNSKLPLNQVATLSIPESRLIVIQPWDKGIIREIERAILSSDLGLTPNNDGKVVRVPIPILSEERRKELVKISRKKAEEFRVSIRMRRREAKEILEGLKKEGSIPEDDLRKGLDRLQEIVDEYTGKVDKLLSEKEKEIMEV